MFSFCTDVRSASCGGLSGLFLVWVHTVSFDLLYPSMGVLKLFLYQSKDVLRKEQPKHVSERADSVPMFRLDCVFILFSTLVRSLEDV